MSSQFKLLLEKFLEEDCTRDVVKSAITLWQLRRELLEQAHTTYQDTSSDYAECLAFVLTDWLKWFLDQSNTNHSSDLVTVLRLVAFLISKSYCSFGYRYRFNDFIDDFRVNIILSKLRDLYRNNKCVCQWVSVALVTWCITYKDGCRISSLRHTDDMLNILMVILNKHTRRSIPTDDLDDATSVLWALSTCVPRTSVEPVDGFDCQNPREAMDEWKPYMWWGSEHVDGEPYLLPLDKPHLLQFIVVVKSLHSHPLLIYRYPEIHAYVTQLLFNDTENAAIMHTLLPEAYTHTRAHGHEHHLLGKPLSEWARVTPLWEKWASSTQAAHECTPLSMPTTVEGVNIDGDLLVTFTSNLEKNNAYKSKAHWSVVQPHLNYLFHGEASDTHTITLHCTCECIQLLVDWMYQSERAPRLHQYNLEQLMEALEIAHLYQLNGPGGFGDCVAARISAVLRQAATELSLVNMYYVWLRVARPDLGIPIHPQLAAWSFETMARMVVDSEKVQESLRKDAESSVGDKRKRELEDTDEVFLKVLDAVEIFLTSRYANV